MKITFVVPYFYPAWQYGGTPRSAFELARGLGRRGHSVQVLTTDSGGAGRLRAIEPDRKQECEGIEVYYYSNLSNSLAYRHRIFWPRKLFQQIRRHIAAADILHIHEFRATTSVSAWRAAAHTGKPYVLSPHGGLQRLGKQLSKTVFDAAWGNRILSNAAALIAVSSIEERDACAFGVHAQRIRLLPNAIDAEEYRCLPPRESFRQKRKLDGRKIVLFLGRLHWIKGADLLVEAFNVVHHQAPESHLVIAGPDEGQAEQLRKRVHALRMDDAITFTGFLGGADKLEALAGADLTVVPSRSEVFSISAIESLACNTPVLMSTACGLCPFPGLQESVISFETGSVSDLAAKLLMMLRAGPVRHNDAAGRDIVLRRLSAEAVAVEAEKIYEEVLQRHG